MSYVATKEFYIIICICSHIALSTGTHATKSMACIALYTHNYLLTDSMSMALLSA